MKKTRWVIVLFVSLILVGAVYFATRLNIFADTVVKQGFGIYKISQFPNLYNTDEPLSDYNKIDIGSKTPVKSVKLDIPKGETEAFVLLLENNTGADVADLSINKQDFSNDQGQTLPGSLIDEKIIHPWPIKAFNIDLTDARRRPLGPFLRDELIVKDESENFLSEAITSEWNTQPKSETPFKASLQNGKSKKLYIKVTSPAEGSGNYKSTLIFEDKNSNRELASLDLELQVLDFDLMSASQAGYTSGCFSNDRIAVANSSELQGGSSYITPELFKKRMKIVKDYGCEAIVQRVGPYADNLKALEIFSELGFQGPIIINFYHYKQNKNIDTWTTISNDQAKQDFRELLTQIKDNRKITLPIIFYGIDEPNDDQQAAMHIEKVKNMDAIVKEVLGDSLGKSKIRAEYSAAVRPRRLAEFEEAGAATRYPIIPFMDIKEVRESGQSSIYYFQGSFEYPLAIRSVSGFANIKNQMKGSFYNTVYGYISTSGRPLWDDFKVSYRDDLNTYRKQMMTFHPAQDGFISTYQAEGRREGMLDLRYYLTFQSMRNSKGSCNNADELENLEKQIDKALADMNLEIERPFRRPTGVKSDDYDDLRSKIKNYLIIYQSNCQSKKVQVESGLRAVGAPFEFNTALPQDGSIEALRFINNSWQKTAGGRLEIKSGEGFYVNNKSTAKQLTTTSSRNSILNNELKLGWNLLFSTHPSTLSDINTLIKNDSCKKIVPLKSLTVLGEEKAYASKIVPIVNNETATTPENAFKYLGYSNSGEFLRKIPAGKNYWFYLFKQPDPASPHFDLYPCL